MTGHRSARCIRIEQIERDRICADCGQVVARVRRSCHRGDAQPRVDSAADRKLVPYPSQQHVYLGFNFRDNRGGNAAHPLFQDARVRRAIAMALDRQAMLQNVFGGRGVLGTGPSARALGDTTVVLPPFDRAHRATARKARG